jgi:16S rRNA (cytosine1402-N4)-methyltransferase
MVDEVVHWLEPQHGATLVDGTTGGGGHTRRLAELVGTTGQIIALDRDPVALDRAESGLKGLPIKLVESNYADIPEVLEQLEIAAVDGILLDLGLSSDQLADDQRGFSFDSEGDLDLRFNANEGKPAWKILETASQEHLADLIYNYGEERYSRRIARAVIQRRGSEPIRNARELAELVRRCVPRGQRQNLDPATRTFQALRIAVNDELKWLQVTMRRMADCLNPGGRIVVISFHSLEDRIVKQSLRDDDNLDVLTKKPIRPTPAEVDRNPRARSAKLRVARRV